MNPIGLPDLETICKKHIPTLRYIPVKFGSVVLTFSPKLSRDVSHSQTAQNSEKLFAIIKCILRASNRGGKKHNQNQKNLLSKWFVSWKAGDYAGLWYEATKRKRY